jgi:hypothetical protein
MQCEFPPDGELVELSNKFLQKKDLSMFMHNKRLQYTVRVAEPNPRSPA